MKPVAATETTPEPSHSPLQRLFPGDDSAGSHDGERGGDRKGDARNGGQAPSDRDEPMAAPIAGAPRS